MRSLTDNPVKPFRVLETFKEPVDIQRYRIMDQRIRAEIGKSYEWLLTKGTESLGVDYASQLIRSLRDTTLGAQLVICGFIKDSAFPKAVPVICLVDDSNLPYVQMRENFAAIGSGLWTAEDALHRRAHEWDTPLKKALYNVAEAKWLGESASGVGEMTTLGVLLPTGRYMNLTKSAWDFLRDRFSKYGPKPLDDKENWEDLPTDFLSPLNG
jgi:hypothetical protein